MSTEPVEPKFEDEDPQQRTPGGAESWFFGAWIGALMASFIIVAFLAGQDHGENKAVEAGAKAAKTAPAKGAEKPAETKTTEEAPADDSGGGAVDGKQVFASTCGGCHTLSAAGASGTMGPNLDELKPDLALVKTAIEKGGTGSGAMPPNLLQGAEADAVAKYVADNAGG